MTANYIAFHAAERPQAVALIAQGRTITYAQFHHDLGLVTQALHALGRPAASSAAVRCADVYFHWLLLLAFERLGITTASIDEREGEEGAPFLATIDLVLSDAPRISTVKQFQPITAEWHRRIFAAAPPVSAAALDGPDDVPLRIVRTSGTTGVPKRLHFTRAVRDAWIRSTNWYVPLDGSSRLLMTLPFTVEAANAALTTCLRAGGTIISVPFNQTSAIPGLIRQHGVTHAGLLPIQLKQLVDEMPADFPKPVGLTFVTFGGAVGDELRAQALARLTDRLYDIYGTNEAGLISLRRTPAPEGVGLVTPGARVEVVDDQDHPVPEGRIGRLRLRGSGMFGGYIDDAEANARMLRDGWFYPGDIGVLLGNRRLKILGRDDEVLDVGGVKFGPDYLEDKVRGLVPVQDLGACSIRNRAGIGEIYLGVVKAPDADDAVYGRVLDAVGRLGLGVFYLVRLDAIPRNANGKIKRKELIQAIAAEATRHDPAWPARVMLDPV